MKNLNEDQERETNRIIYDLESIRRARPYIRSILAFINHLRFNVGRDQCYKDADIFITQLESDIKNNRKQDL